MTAAVPRALVEAFYKAYAARDAAKVAEFLDDDVEWTISGPVDVLPFCGTRHGKAAVLDLSQGVLFWRRLAGQFEDAATGNDWVVDLNAQLADTEGVELGPGLALLRRRIRLDLDELQDLIFEGLFELFDPLQAFGDLTRGRPAAPIHIALHDASFLSGPGVGALMSTKILAIN